MPQHRLPTFLTSLILGAALLAVLGYAAWYALAAPASQLLCSTIQSGSREHSAVALTFDDGPGPETPQLLEALKDNGAKATFFLCGENARRYPELVRRIAAEGHCIGNHAYSHRRFLGRSKRWMSQEIQSTAQLLSSLLADHHSANGAAPAPIFRPPYGLRWFGMGRLLDDAGLTTILWDVNSEDWKRSPWEIVDRVVRLTKPGSIILLHDGIPPNESQPRSSTAAALPEILRVLGGRFQFVTVPELLDSQK